MAQTKKVTKKKVAKKSQDTELFELVNSNADNKALERAYNIRKRNERAFYTITLGSIFIAVILLWWGWNNMYFVIDGRLPSLNEYINAERSNRYKGAKLKKDTERLIKLYITKSHKFCLLYTSDAADDSALV